MSLNEEQINTIFRVLKSNGYGAQGDYANQYAYDKYRRFRPIDSIMRDIAIEIIDELNKMERYADGL